MKVRAFDRLRSFDKLTTNGFREMVWRACSTWFEGLTTNGLSGMVRPMFWQKVAYMPVEEDSTAFSSSVASSGFTVSLRAASRRSMDPMCSGSTPYSLTRL